MNMNIEMPTNVELEEIQELRDSLDDLKLCDDALSNINLLRFIRARNHKVIEAEEMFRNAVDWYDEHDLKGILSEKFPEILCKANYQPICGYDNYGGPIMLSPMGSMDIQSLLSAGLKEQLIRHNFQTYERNSFVCRVQMKAKEAEYYFPVTTIVDLEGLGWRHFTPDVLSIIMTCIQYLEAYYPETTRNLVFINTPSIFTFFWKVAKPFVSVRTLAKIQIHGSDREQWEAALLKLASEDQLPQKYGGNLPDDIDISPCPQDCVPKQRGCY